MNDDAEVLTPEDPTEIRLATLVLLRNGTETDVTFVLAPPATIGRFDATVGPVDVDMAGLDPEGGYVSRRHARIEVRDDEWWITDLGSSNGTWVLRSDYERVDEAPLADGDQFALGNARFVFRTGSVAPAVEEQDAPEDAEAAPEFET